MSQKIQSKSFMDSSVIFSSDPIVRLVKRIILISFLSVTAWGLPTVETKPNAGKEEIPPLSVEDRLIDKNIEVSEWFDDVAESVDIYLAGGKKLTRARNETNVTLTNSTYVVERQPVVNATNLGVNLRLPNVEHYWNVKFTTYDESKERGVKDTHLRQAPREKNYGATIGLFKKLGNIRTAFRPRVDLQDPIKVSHSLAFESAAEDKEIQIRPKLEFFANGDQGTGIFQAINVNLTLSKKWSLSFINEGEYENNSHTYSVTNGFAFGQSLNKKTSLSYGLFLSSNNKPSYSLQAYTLSFGLSHNLYKKILDMSLVPQLTFPRGNDFKPVAGAGFNINVNF